MFVIEQPLPAAPAADFEAQVLAQWNAVYDAYNKVACLILGSMTPELHRQFENSSPYDIIKELKSMFEKQARMKDYVEQLERLGYVLSKTIDELHALLIEYEKGLPKKAATPQVMVIQGGRIQKSNKKSLTAKGKEAGYWKRNYTVYLVELIKKKKQVGTASSSGIFTIELFSFPNKSWVYDTGCGTHICNTKQGLIGARKLIQEALYLYVGNGVCAQVEAIGSHDLILPNGLVICLDNCHYAPTITRGVVSVSCLIDNGFTECFTDYRISVSKNYVLYFNAISSNGIYEIDMINRVSGVNFIYTVSNKRAKHNFDSTFLWHCHLAYISKKRIENLQHDGLLKLTDKESFDKCVSCLSGKMKRKPFPHRIERATDLLGIIHIDVCGPLRHVSRQDASYFITFTNDYNRYGYVYLLKHKHEVLETFKLIPPYTPQHNRVSKRRNRTLLDMVRSMMNITTLPLSFWDYALETATCILNMVPTKKVDKTPYELWYGKVPNLSYLKVWGCEALVKRDTSEKLQQRSVKCIFVEYPKETMGYYFYFQPENKTVVARHAKFLEKNLLSQEIGRRTEELKEIQDEDTSPSENSSEIPMEVEGFEQPQEEVIPWDLNEPTNYKASILDPESDKWLDAMNAKMQSMKDNQVWCLVDLPPNSKGYTQTFEVDYEETFSPVADIRAIRILIAIAAFYDCEIWQMDVKAAFLNGYLDEDIYMVQPKGFIDPKHPRKVCKLQRSIYGLKQASRS
ncbi:retrotransposon protein, putative, ty1-copia subclass [Tanacetum coccineum]